ncbi:MAG: sugar transferase [Bacteroidetes bacterium]|nr:sugar transferase [Bacteroidota bacterium]
MLPIKGSFFFFQARPGLDEKIFKIIKFKTMNLKYRNGAERLITFNLL